MVAVFSSRIDKLRFLFHAIDCRIFFRICKFNNRVDEFNSRIETFFGDFKDQKDSPVTMEIVQLGLLKKNQFRISFDYMRESHRSLE